MPLTPHEQEVLDAITENLHAQGVMQELPFPEPERHQDYLAHVADRLENGADPIEVAKAIRRFLD